MTLLGRLVILATAAQLLAACDTPPRPSNSASPQATAVAGASPTASPIPTSTARPIPSFPPEPGEACPILDADFEVPPVSIAFRLGHVQGNLERVRATAGDGSSALRSSPHVDAAGVLPGGRSLELELATSYALESLGYGLRENPVLETVDAVVRFGDGSSVPLVTEIGSGPPGQWEVVVKGLPDTDATASIEFAAAWSDRCLAYDATGALPVEIHSRATVGECALEWPAIGEQLEALSDSPLQLGSVEARLGASYVDGTYVQVPGGDGAYPLSMFDTAEDPAVVTPGELLTMRSTEDDITIRARDALDTELLWYERDVVIRYLDAGGAYGTLDAPAVAFRSAMELAGDGSFSVTSPASTGRYVAALAVGFEARCYSGAVVAAVGVDVERP